MLTLTLPRSATVPQVSALIRSAPPPLLPDLAPAEPFIGLDADSGEPVVAVLRAPPNVLESLRHPLLSYNHVGGGVIRSNGQRTQSAVFGWTAPLPIRRRYVPTLSALDRDNHPLAAGLRAGATTWAALLREALPQVAAEAESATAGVSPAWRLGESWWTSGVINRDAALLYHRDANNLPAWSAMLVVRAGVAGGYLHIADYDLLLPCRDGDVVCFPGYRLVHSVTPMRKRLSGGYRVTVVHYPVKSFAGLGDPVDEFHAGRRKETSVVAGALERQRASGLLK
jgi:hypothetical protein